MDNGDPPRELDPSSSGPAAAAQRAREGRWRAAVALPASFLRSAAVAQPVARSLLPPSRQLPEIAAGGSTRLAPQRSLSAATPAARCARFASTAQPASANKKKTGCMSQGAHAWNGRGGRERSQGAARQGVRRSRSSGELRCFCRRLGQTAGFRAAPTCWCAPGVPRSPELRAAAELFVNLKPDRPYTGNAHQRMRGSSARGRWHALAVGYALRQSESRQTKRVQPRSSR